MQSVKIFGLSLFAVVLLILVGLQQMSHNQDLGVFFVFVGGCTAIGLLFDLIHHVKGRIRRNNVRKLHP